MIPDNTRGASAPARGSALVRCHAMRNQVCPHPEPGGILREIDRLPAGANAREELLRGV